MYVNFEQVHNYCERLVFEEVVRRSGDFQHFTPEMLGDVACVALNRMPVRYVRHDVDLVFYLTEAERHEIETRLDAAVTEGFNYVNEWMQRRVAAAEAEAQAEAATGNSGSGETPA